MFTAILVRFIFPVHAGCRCGCSSWDGSPWSRKRSMYVRVRQRRYSYIKFSAPFLSIPQPAACSAQGLIVFCSSNIAILRRLCFGARTIERTLACPARENDAQVWQLTVTCFNMNVLFPSVSYMVHVGAGPPRRPASYHNTVSIRCPRNIALWVDLTLLKWYFAQHVP